MSYMGVKSIEAILDKHRSVQALSPVTDREGACLGLAARICDAAFWH
jgi:hypothetical protein